MKIASSKRQLEIDAFSIAVRAAGAKLVPHEGADDRRDADRIRAIAVYLGIENPEGRPSPAVKKWWYAQNAPARPSAKLILNQLERLNWEGSGETEFDKVTMGGADADPN